MLDLLIHWVKCQQVSVQDAPECVMPSIDFINSNSLLIYVCSWCFLPGGRCCSCGRRFLSALPQQPLVFSVSVAGCAGRTPTGATLPSSRQTELLSLHRTPLEMSFSQCFQSAGAGQNLRPSVKNHVEPGSKAALFHQGMFSLDIISTLLVKELRPDFFSFF